NRVRPLPQNTLKPPAISRFTLNPPRSPTGIAPRHDVSSRNSATPHVPRSSKHPSVPVGSFRNTGQEARARENENRVGNLPSGDPITCRILRLASSPLPPRTTATLNVHILSREDHAVNVHLPGRQPVGVNPSAAKNNRHPKRPHPKPPRSCSQRPLTWTPTSQRPPLAANSN
ncbi:hypothetical protein Taro_004822, partial [Colocasia esculenta]|nr:hypothetical protein [Colocasia esculenta]